MSGLLFITVRVRLVQTRVINLLRYTLLNDVRPQYAYSHGHLSSQSIYECITFKMNQLLPLRVSDRLLRVCEGGGGWPVPVLVCPNGHVTAMFV